jgi:hypothetical protein
VTPLCIGKKIWLSTPTPSNSTSSLAGTRLLVPPNSPLLRPHLHLCPISGHHLRRGRVLGLFGRSLGSARGARGWQPAGGAIGSPTLTPRPGLGANLRIRWISRFQFCHSLLFSVICLVQVLIVCRVSNTSPLSTSHPPEESTSTR